MAKIDLSITKRGKFRVKIDEDPYMPSYEVTVGSAAWQKGRGYKHKTQIYNMITRLVDNVLTEYDLLKIKDKD